jgi:ArsR family transcriptional regulator
VLKDAGLLSSERRGSWVYYSVVSGALINLASVLSTSADDDVTTGSPT